MTNTFALPIDDALPALCSAMKQAGRAVLIAPPGAGKTTRVPLALLDQVTGGRIIMLEPRRLAARAAAARLASELGQEPGQDIGFRIRGKSVSGTRIEVVTEGILTRMLQSDPSLEGIGCVIFDEFHERSLNADLGLALTWEARGALRPDLGILVMSATLDAGPVAKLLDDAPVIESMGHAFPVETRYLPRPLPAATRFDQAASQLIAYAEAETRDNPGGTILTFLPGEGEIRRVSAVLSDLPCEIMPLYGAMAFREQQAALAPVLPGRQRRIVLATSIAETSLTIPDIRVVIDCGRTRRARFDPGSGMSRLVTERVSRAEAGQRRGRAGRVSSGICYRMWTRAEEGALPEFAPPEIAMADLTGLALELANWGSDSTDLAFLTPPPLSAMTGAGTLLYELGALDGTGRITRHGRKLAALPVHPRIAHMLVSAGRQAAGLAALMEDRDPLRGAGSDMTQRLRALHDPARSPPQARMTLERIRRESKRLSRLSATGTPPLTPGAMAALAYPDRIGIRRPGNLPRYLLSGGSGAILPEGDAMAAEPFLVATDLDGDGREAQIRLAVPVTESDLRNLYRDRIRITETVEWSSREGRILARIRERLGALILAERPLTTPDKDSLARAAWEGMRLEGLPWTPKAARLRARVRLLPNGPDISDRTLLEDGDWLLPFLGKVRNRSDLKALDLTQPLLNLLGWDGQKALNQIAPASFTTPLGRQIPIDYDAETPSIEVRLQELFGLTAHPMIGRQPLRITMLSPGQKPVAVTTDLPGFWAGSYVDVRKDMRGRYPKHPWPEDPTGANPTLQAKPPKT